MLVITGHSRKLCRYARGIRENRWRKRKPRELSGAMDCGLLDFQGE